MKTFRLISRNFLINTYVSQTLLLLGDLDLGICRSESVASVPTISPFASEPEIMVKIIICCQHALWSVNLFVLARTAVAERTLSRCRRGRRLMAVARCARHSKMLGNY